MSKKVRILVIIILAAVAAAVLVVPIPKGTLDDGGTREYAALTYRIVKWKRVYDDGTYEKTRVYSGKNLKKSLDELWDAEYENVEHSFNASVEAINGSIVTVKPVSGEEEEKTCDKICFGTSSLEQIEFQVGTLVRVTYKGNIEESYPARINAVSWKHAEDLRYMAFSGEWLDKASAEKLEGSASDNIYIRRIFADCFFAEFAVPMPYELKINGSLPAEYCVGDMVLCTYENRYMSEDGRVEAELVSVEPSDWKPDPNVAYKPVIYLYPESETAVSVSLELDGALTCTYPVYKDGWRVKAHPDGTLTDESGRAYNYLYWEGEINAEFDFSNGFCVKGCDTAAFLETALEKLGLNRREANEFIVFWLPLMEPNPYNVISFQTKSYTDAAGLEVEPAPDTVIRVFMAWHAAAEYEKLPAQTLTAPERRGFTVVEWGGTEVIGKSSEKADKGN